MEAKGQHFYSNSLFSLFGADGVIVIFLPPAHFFSLFHSVTASRHGVLWAGEVGDERIPLVPPRHLDEMGFFSVPLLSQGHGMQEAHRTETRTDWECSITNRSDENRQAGAARGAFTIF